jgi:hypothetical protein
MNRRSGIVLPLPSTGTRGGQLSFLCKFLECVGAFPLWRIRGRNMSDFDEDGRLRLRRERESNCNGRRYDCKSAFEGWHEHFIPLRYFL